MPWAANTSPGCSYIGSSSSGRSPKRKSSRNQMSNRRSGEYMACGGVVASRGRSRGKGTRTCATRGPELFGCPIGWRMTPDCNRTGDSTPTTFCGVLTQLGHRARNCELACCDATPVAGTHRGPATQRDVVIRARQWQAGVPWRNAPQATAGLPGCRQPRSRDYPTELGVPPLIAMPSVSQPRASFPGSPHSPPRPHRNRRRRPHRRRAIDGAVPALCTEWECRRSS